MKLEDAQSDRYRLGSKEICFGGGPASDIENLPPTLQELLERSDNLYRRIARLDDVLFGNAAAPAGARGAMKMLEQAFSGQP